MPWKTMNNKNWRKGSPSLNNDQLAVGQIIGSASRHNKDVVKNWTEMTKSKGQKPSIKLIELLICDLYGTTGFAPIGWEKLSYDYIIASWKMIKKKYGRKQGAYVVDLMELGIMHKGDLSQFLPISTIQNPPIEVEDKSTSYYEDIARKWQRRMKNLKK